MWNWIYAYCSTDKCLTEMLVIVRNRLPTKGIFVEFSLCFVPSSGVHCVQLTIAPIELLSWLYSWMVLHRFAIVLVRNNKISIPKTISLQMCISWSGCCVAFGDLRVVCKLWAKYATRIGSNPTSFLFWWQLKFNFLSQVSQQASYLLSELKLFYLVLQ